MVSSTSLTALSPALWFSFLCKILSNTEVAVVKQGISDANTVLHNFFFFFPPTTFMYLFNLYLFSGNFRWRCSAALTSEYLYSFYQHETLLNMESCDHPGWNCEILCWISGVTSGFCFDVVFNSLLFTQTYSSTQFRFLEHCSNHKFKRSSVKFDTPALLIMSGKKLIYGLMLRLLTGYASDDC